jgi:hypothetical protein
MISISLKLLLLMPPIHGLHFAGQKADQPCISLPKEYFLALDPALGRLIFPAARLEHFSERHNLTALLMS